MTNEVKKVPQLRFPNFGGEWEEKQLGDVTKTNQGLQIAISDRKTKYEKGLYFYITNEFLRPNSQTKYYIENPPESVVAEKSDILMTRTGNTGKVITNVEGAFHNNFFKIKYNKSIIDRLFLFELLKSPKINNKFLSLAGTSTIPDLNHSDFYSVYISFPTISEQQKISTFFSKLDRQIELEEQKLEKLKEQKKGYMQKIFSQELRFKDENGNAYPEWKERKFSELLSYSSNGVDKKINKNHDIAYMVNYMDVFKKTKLNTKNRDLLMEITATKIQKEKNNLKKGDILFTPSSETREDIAKSTVVFEDLDNTVYSYHLIRLRPLDSNIFSLKYSNYLSEQNFISKQFRRLAQGAQRYTLTKEHFENIKLNLPHIKEQEKIGAFFSKLDEVINKQSQKIDELKLRKQGFLQKMFV